MHIKARREIRSRRRVSLHLVSALCAGGPRVAQPSCSSLDVVQKRKFCRDGAQISRASAQAKQERTNCEVLDVVAVHDVDVEPVSTALDHRSALICQAGEVRRQD